MSSTLFHADRLFTGDEVYTPGVVEVRADRIVSVGPAPANGPPAGAERLVGTVVPGYVDVHCHGGGGAAFATATQEAVAAVAALHRGHGSTSVVASLVTDSIERIERQVSALMELAADGELPGVHLEGPWLATNRRGAHPAAMLRNPVPEEVERLLTLGRGTVRMVTLAPELEGGMEAIGRVAAHGAVAAIGHTEADYDTTMAAIEAGATGATHLFNAMPGLAHRAPGPILALLSDDRVWLELIADNVHLHPKLVAWVIRKNPKRAALITDAMAAAGAPDGDYTLGLQAVEVRGGVARLAGQDTIAGSTLTLDRAVQHAVAAGVDWQQAVRAASTQPAAYLGLDQVGLLAPGRRADLLVLDEQFTVLRVLHRGRWAV